MKLLLGQEEGLRHGLQHSQSTDAGKESLLKVGEEGVCVGGGGASPASAASV